MRKLIERCPGCGAELTVTRMGCRQCHTRVEGEFRPSAFDRLSPESLAFIELFVRRKGNLKEMERELALPYSTVRSRLDEVVRELGPTSPTPAEPSSSPAPPTPPAPPAAPSPPNNRRNDARRQAILDRLDKGDISLDEAIDQLGGSTDE